MVLVKMLMEIPLSRWEEHWWWRWRWFPPPGGKCPRQNSSAGALDWFRQGSASWRRSLVPKACLLFFSHGRLHIAEDGHQRATRGPTRQGARPGGRARPQHLWMAGGPPLVLSSLNIFYLFQNNSPWGFRTVGVVQNRSLIFAPFPAHNSSCWHSPSSCKPCKIREKRHKYCAIMCNNNP